jgi:hypothetical protein
VGPKPGVAAVAATNAAIIALAKAFAEQGIKDGVKVNSVSPGAVMTGRRQSFFEKWAPAHHLTLEEAIKKYPEEGGISRFGEPEEIADLLAFLVSTAANSKASEGAAPSLQTDTVGSRHESCWRVTRPFTTPKRKPLHFRGPLASHVCYMRRVGVLEATRSATKTKYLYPISVDSTISVLPCSRPPAQMCLPFVNWSISVFLRISPQQRMC